MKLLHKIKLIGMGTLLASTLSEAGVWGSWIAGGTSCNNYNVQAIENGDSLSVLFDEFGINMPQGDVGDGLTSRKSCSFRIQLTPPKGYYLANLTQVYRGGIIKSADSSAQLNIRYNVGSVVGRPLPINFQQGTSISPGSSRSNFSQSYTNNLLVASCGGSTTYGINMSMAAQRRNYNSYLVGGLDSVDADFVQELVLIPEWRLCP